MNQARKIIAGLLAAYMLTLLLLPCNDACGAEQHKTPLTFHAVQEHHEAANDICSPFCYCDCCATAMTADHFPAFSIVPHFSVKIFTAFYQSFLSKELSSIWQPPKFS